MFTFIASLFVYVTSPNQVLLIFTRYSNKEASLIYFKSIVLQYIHTSDYIPNGQYSGDT